MEQPTTSDAETLGYRTARSAAGSDNSSDAGDSHQETTNGGPTSQQDSQNDDFEVEELPDDYAEPQKAQPGEEAPKKTTSKDSPAYVAPIGSLGAIPSIGQFSSGPQPESPKDSSEAPRKLPIYQIPKDHLVGKKINEFGDIVDDDGKVLGRVEGDLPSMVGRAISNARGDVLGDGRELLGYVAGVETGEGQQKQSEEQQPTRSLVDVEKAMAAQGQGPGGLRVDQSGNILDAEGNIVGSFKDKYGFGKKAASGSSKDNAGASNARPQGSQPEDVPREKRPKAQAESSSQSQAPKINAQSHRKEPAERQESPSDIFMDIKSTAEGIQLTVRIPTVFNNGGKPLQPKIVFS